MNNTTPGEILTKFYAENNLEPDGGEKSSSVKIDLAGGFHFYIPNFNARRKALLKHDVHHLLTEYSTSLSGESEISAWEIASGCKKYWAAFLIDTSGFMMGIPINLFGVLKAFARGRRTKNLYHNLFSNDKALGMTISELRNELCLDKHPKESKPTLTDFLFFSGFALFGLVYSIISLALLPLIILYSIYIEVKTKMTRRK